MDEHRTTTPPNYYTYQKVRNNRQNDFAHGKKCTSTYSITHGTCPVKTAFLCINSILRLINELRTITTHLGDLFGQFDVFICYQYLVVQLKKIKIKLSVRILYVDLLTLIPVYMVKPKQGLVQSHRESRPKLVVSRTSRLSNNVFTSL